MAIRVLIVDDSSAVRLIVRRCLEQAEIRIGEIWEAGNGEEALGVLAERTADLILSDINMPKMDGIQLLSALKQDRRWASIPVVMLTTEAASQLVVGVIRMGAAGYIKKPFTPAQIQDKIAPLIKAGAQASMQNEVPMPQD